MLPVLTLREKSGQADVKDVSPQFWRDIETLFSQTPNQLLAKFENSGWQVLLAPFAAARLNDLFQHPKFFKPNSTDRAAVFQQGDKFFIFFEHHRDPLSGMIRKETLSLDQYQRLLGQAFDREEALSLDPTFIAAHEKALASLRPQPWLSIADPNESNLRRPYAMQEGLKRLHARQLLVAESVGNLLKAHQKQLSQQNDWQLGAQLSEKPHPKAHSLAPSKLEQFFPLCYEMISERLKPFLNEDPAQRPESMPSPPIAHKARL